MSPTGHISRHTPTPAPGGNVHGTGAPLSATRVQDGMDGPRVDTAPTDPEHDITGVSGVGRQSPDDTRDFGQHAQSMSDADGNDLRASAGRHGRSDEIGDVDATGES